MHAAFSLTSRRVSAGGVKAMGVTLLAKPALGGVTAFDLFEPQQ